MSSSKSGHTRACQFDDYTTVVWAQTDSRRFAFSLAFIWLLIHMCTHFNSSAMPAHYRTKSRTFPKTYLPSREPGLQILILVWWADCYPALSTPRAKAGLLMGPSSSLSCASPILRRPHSIGDFPFFHPSNRSSKYPAPFSPTTTCLFSGDCRGAKETLSAFRIYNRGIHVDSSRACRTVRSSALVTTRSWAGHSLCSDFRTQKVAASNERH